MKTILTNNPGVTGEEILLVPTDKGIAFLNINSIVRVEAISNYSRLFFSDNKTMVVAKLLRWFEERLSLSDGQPGTGRELFIRIHRTHLVNKKFIRYYELGKIKLANGECIDVAKRKRTHFFKCLNAAA